MNYGNLINKMISIADQTNQCTVEYDGYQFVIRDQIGRLCKDGACVAVRELHEDEFPSVSDQMLMEAGFIQPFPVLGRTIRTALNTAKREMEKFNLTCMPLIYVTDKVEIKTAKIKVDKNGTTVITITDNGKTYTTKTSSENKPEKWWKNVRYNSGLKKW